MVCNQIWLNVFMEDYHFGYIMKLKNKHIGWKSKLILMGKVQPSNFGTCYFWLFSFYPPFFFISFILQKVLYKGKTTPKTATSTCTKNNEKYNLMKEYHKDAKNGTMFFCQAFVKHSSNQQIKRRQKQCQH